MAAKLGLILLCSNCRQPITLHHLEQKMTGLRSVWIHETPGDDRRFACFQDVQDGCAYPMSEWDLQDFHDEIMRYDWYYEGREPTEPTDEEPTDEELWM